MSATELEQWLRSEDSTGSGWSKGDGSGETIGHESGRKIVEILKKNPEKDPEGYDDGVFLPLLPLSLFLFLFWFWVRVF